MPEEAEEAPPPPKRKRKVESEEEEPPLGDDVKKAEKPRAEAKTSSSDRWSGRAPRAILHLDMDAFYASVEQRDDPDLRGQPSSWAATPSAASCWPPPTRCGRSACAARCRWRGRCASRPSDCRAAAHRAYADASERVFDILSSVTPLVEALSLDEAFLDVTASRWLSGRPRRSPACCGAHRRRARPPSSAGIADVKFVAKIASDLAKPNGQREVPPGGGAAFLAPLPIGASGASARRRRRWRAAGPRRSRRPRARASPPRWSAGWAPRLASTSRTWRAIDRATSSPIARPRASAPRRRSTTIRGRRGAGGRTFTRRPCASGGGCGARGCARAACSSS